MSAWWYWALLALAMLGWAAVPLAAKWEHRQDVKDRELWERITRYTR